MQMSCSPEINVIIMCMLTWFKDHGNTIVRIYLLVSSNEVSVNLVYWPLSFKIYSFQSVWLNMKYFQSKFQTLMFHSKKCSKLRCEFHVIYWKTFWPLLGIKDILESSPAKGIHRVLHPVLPQFFPFQGHQHRHIC